MTGTESTFVDFGKTARDYAEHRPGFPREFFDHVARLGIGVSGQRVLDLGTGTGTLALGFAERGCRVVGLDPSPAMLREAEAVARAKGLDIRWVEAKAEETGQGDGAFDVVSAGTCWHWFDPAAAARETMRVLAPGGSVVIAYFTYLPEKGTLAEATEALVLQHNPTWSFAGYDGRWPAAVDDLSAVGFRDVTTFEFVLPIPFTHTSWRGRFRACNGVLTLPAESIQAFDDDLKALLAAHYPEAISVDHRVYGVVATKA